MTEYDEYYQQEEYFGEPYPDMIAFFQQYPHKGSVVDLGCGQGRDSIALAELGYTVTGVDLSKVGIEQMLQKAETRQVSVQGIVSDLHKCNVSPYDMVLLDSIVHFHKEDLSREIGLIQKICKEMKPDGILCNCLIRSKKTEQILKDAIEGLHLNFSVLKDSYVDYPKFDAVFHFYAVQKIAN